MQQKIFFSRGIDSDTSPEAFQEGVGRYRIGVRVMNSRDGEEQAAEPVLGNTQVAYNLPSGTNKVVGSYEYKLRQKIYYFVYNSSSNHLILEYDQVTDIVARVFQDAILNFQPDLVITGINVIERDKDNHLLYWSDGWISPSDANEFNEPKKINVEKGKFHMNGDYVNGYKFPFNAEILYRIKQPPKCAPTVSWSGLDEQGGTFEASNANALVTIEHGLAPVGLQFDNPYFNPNSEFNSSTGEWKVGATGEYFISSVVDVAVLPPAPTSGYVEAVIYLTVTSGGVSTDIVLDHTPPMTLSSFVSGHTLSVSSTVTLNAGDIVTIRGEVDGPGAQMSSAIFKGSSFKSFESSAVVNEVNRLFKKNFQFQVGFIYDDFEHSVLSSMSNYVLPETVGSQPTGEDIIRQDNKITIRVPTGNSIVKKLRIVAKELDSSVFSLIATIDKDILGIQDNTIYEYEFKNDILGVPLDPDDSVRLMDWVPLSSTSQELIDGTRITDGLITENFDPVTVDIRLPLTYDFLTRNTNAGFPAVQELKSGQSYVYGIEYQDHGGRIGLVNITKGDFDRILQDGRYGTTLNIPFLTESAYNPNYVATTPSTEMNYVPKVSAEFYHEPPVWAKTWKLIRSKGRAMGRYFQFAAQQIVYLDGAGAGASAATATTVKVEIENITGIYLRDNKLSTLSYSFDKGDRIRFIAQQEGVGPSYNDIQPFLAFNDSSVDSYDELTGVLTISLDGANSILRTIGWGVLFEIYHPTPSVADNKEFLYEVAQCGDVIELADGRRAHAGGSVEQSYFDFFGGSGYTTSGVPGTTVGFIGNPNTEIVIGDKVKVAQDAGFAHSSYNTYATVVDVRVVAGFTVLVTDIPFVGASTSTGGLLTKAAVISLTGGDCFRRFANMPLIDGGAVKRLYSYVETSSASNMFSSEFYDYGRPNIVDDNIKRITRPATIRYSGQFIPQSFINGLSAVDGLAFEEYHLPYGGIYKLFYMNQTLKVFQELKIGSIPIDQILYTDAQGGQVVGISEKVLSPQVIYYKGELGIGQHPESFAWYNGAGYGIDVKAGIHWRLANDGLTPISKLYKMNSFYTKKCADILSSSSRVRILGAYDINYGEYIVAFDGYTNGSEVEVPAVTLAFNEDKNQWSTFHFYQPEMMSSSGVGLVTFKDGNIYTHDTNPLHNNFYGVQYKPELWFYCNVGSSKKKVFEALSLECKDTWDVIIETPITRQNPEGQHTEMIGANFVIKEGFPYVDILKDDFTPNIVAGAPYLPNARFTGNPMRGVHALVKLQFQEDSHTTLWACNVLVIPSERSDR